MDVAVRKAVIPAAGLGTRFLPATKATPKEMLPVVDKPAIQYVVEEAVRAGCEDILMVTGRNKGSLEDHFDRVPELEAALEAKGDKDRLAAVRATDNLGTLHFIRQHEPRGLGHAVLCAAPHVGEEPFAVLLGDDLIDEREDLLERMIATQAKHGGSVVALLEVPRAQIKLYGAAVAREPDADGVVRVDDLVEKPDPDETPSTLAIIGRYVLSPAVFEELRRTEPGAGGEIQLTDALKALAQRPDGDGEPVHGVVFSGRRYDTGDRGDYLRTVVTLASERADLGPEFLRWLRGFVADHPEDG
ncbi:MAG: UTP--glucose-1-phosphate uridylyltransferase GalU [Actinomycetota bacterium]|nr:UTP--glucose-1-phosphate uridylyltransferase GalU [Actinomycetota bacterium]